MRPPGRLGVAVQLRPGGSGPLVLHPDHRRVLRGPGARRPASPPAARADRRGARVPVTQAQTAPPPNYQFHEESINLMKNPAISMKNPSMRSVGARGTGPPCLGGLSPTEAPAWAWAELNPQVVRFLLCRLGVCACRGVHVYNRAYDVVPYPTTLIHTLNIYTCFHCLKEMVSFGRAMVMFSSTHSLPIRPPSVGRAAGDHAEQS